MTCLQQIDSKGLKCCSYCQPNRRMLRHAPDKFLLQDYVQGLFPIWRSNINDHCGCPIRSRLQLSVHCLNRAAALIKSSIALVKSSNYLNQFCIANTTLLSYTEVPNMARDRVGACSRTCWDIVPCVPSIRFNSLRWTTYEGTWLHLSCPSDVLCYAIALCYIMMRTSLDIWVYKLRR